MAAGGTWVGQSLAAGATYDIPEGALASWSTDIGVFDFCWRRRF